VRFGSFLLGTLIYPIYLNLCIWSLVLISVSLCTLKHKFPFCNILSSESEEEGPVRASAKLQSGKQRVVNLDGEIAGLRKKRPVFNQTLINKGMGNWEKHTRGIGAKLLLQVFSTAVQLLPCCFHWMRLEPVYDLN
jgi:hypothetical protein